MITISDKFIIITTFPCCPDDRKKMENCLTQMGWKVDGGGTAFDNGKPIYSDIVLLNKGQFFCLCCGADISEQQFRGSTLCGHCDCGHCKDVPDRTHNLFTYKYRFNINWLNDEVYMNQPLPKGIRVLDKDFYSERIKTCHNCSAVVIDRLLGKATCENGFDLSRSIKHIDTGSFVVVTPKECKQGR